MNTSDEIMTDASPARGFPASEYEARVDRAQRLMAAAGLDALLLTTEPEFRYFSGFLTQFWLSPTRPWFLVIPAAGKPIAVVPGIGAPLMETTWIDDIRTWPSPRPDDEGISLLAETLRRVAGKGGRIGIPMGAETTLRMPLRDYARLQKALLESRLVDDAGLVRELRMVKSQREIDKIAHICRIASDAFDAVPEWAAAGRPLSGVFRRFRIELLQRDADDVPYLAGAAAPGGYANVIAPPGDAPLSKGDLLMMDTGAVYDGYFCDFDRNWSIGRAGDAERRAYDTLFRATEAGFEAARPGATCADLFGAMRRVIVDDGYECGNVGRLGHGLGMQLTEWPSHTATDLTRLTPGMVLTLEPGLSIDAGRGMVHEENIVIRERGAEFLSRRAAPMLPEIP